MKSVLVNKRLFLSCAFLAEVSAWKDELNCASDEFAMRSPAVWITLFSLHRPLVLWFDCHTVTPRKRHRVWKRHHKRCPKLHELSSWLAALHHGHLGPKPWSFWLIGAYFCVFCCNGPHNVLQICPKKLGKTAFCLSHSWSQSSPWRFTTW